MRELEIMSLSPTTYQGNKQNAPDNKFNDHISRYRMCPVFKESSIFFKLN